MDLYPTIRDLLARGAAQEASFEQAAAVFQKFGREVFVRGVVEVFNFCHENRACCRMRRDNRLLERARAQHDEIAELLIHQRPSAIINVNLQTDEDLVAAREVVLPLVRTLRRDYLLYKREQFIMDEARVLAAIAAEGLEPSVQSMTDYFEQNAAAPAVATTT
jgi:hypothetical protein